MNKHTDAECKVIKSDELEVEISSGSMTRLAGVSQGLVGAEGIHLAVAAITEKISEMAQPVSSEEEIKHIATVSANGIPLSESLSPQRLMQQEKMAQ